MFARGHEIGSCLAWAVFGGGGLSARAYARHTRPTRKQETRAPILLGHHHLDKLFVVDLSITIDISFADHLIDLLISELLSKVGHDVTQLGSGDESVSVLVEDLERLEDLLLGIGVLHLSGHHRKELGEINCSITVSVNFVDHIGELRLRRVLSEGAHDGSKFFGGDSAISVLIEQGERLLELSDLFLGKLISCLQQRWRKRVLVSSNEQAHTDVFECVR